MSGAPLRFLADESCDFAVVRALRAAGFDVEAVGESATSSRDVDVIDQALRERRVLVTEDKDFGWLVYAQKRRSHGVVLLRFPVSARSRMSLDVLTLVRTRAEDLSGAFVVLEPGVARVHDIET